MRPALTHQINGVDVGKLREELTTAEGELGVGLEELLSGETKPDMKMTHNYYQIANRRKQKLQLRVDNKRIGRTGERAEIKL